MGWNVSAIVILKSEEILKWIAQWRKWNNSNSHACRRMFGVRILIWDKIKYSINQPPAKVIQSVCGFRLLIHSQTKPRTNKTIYIFLKLHFIFHYNSTVFSSILFNIRLSTDWTRLTEYIYFSSFSSWFLIFLARVELFFIIVVIDCGCDIWTYTAFESFSRETEYTAKVIWLSKVAQQSHLWYKRMKKIHNSGCNKLFRFVFYIFLSYVQ